MLIVHVHIKVKPDQVDAFRAACIENSTQHSIFNSVANELLKFIALSNVVHIRTLYLKARMDFNTPSMSSVPNFGNSGSSS